MNDVYNFLDQLKKNNNREWFHSNKEEFETVKAKVRKIFDRIYDELSLIENLEPLKVYRINRDIRFSLDKTPYKTHFSAFVGRKKPYNRGGFYIHIEPNNCFIGGGFWGPESSDLLRIRKAIDESDELEIILNEKVLKDNFDELYGSELKTAPKGFSKEHERVHLLRKKQYLLIKHFDNNAIFKDNFPEQVAKSFEILLPFYNYMTEVLTTNENGESLI